MDLKARGFDPILDQTHLKPGKDILQFAEFSVESADYVLLVCTPNYAIKANNRSFGVGWEVSMITSELFNGADGKFIAILADGSPELSIPKFMKTKLYVDVREEKFPEAWNQLCTHMLNKGDSNQIGDLIYLAMFTYDRARIFDQPRLPELKRFTQFIDTGKDVDDRWYVIRKDPVKGDYATILFQE